MRIAAPLISYHRLYRYHRWMLLWLKWFAAFLNQARAFAPFPDPATAIAHQWLDRIERVLIRIVIIRAAPRVRAVSAPKHSARPRKERGLSRAIIGSAMRKKLRAKDLSQRIEALSQDVDVLVARLLRRLPRGLTRRRPILPCAEPRPIAPALVCAEASRLADTS